jgi:hypothetical protein
MDNMNNLCKHFKNIKYKKGDILLHQWEKIAFVQTFFLGKINIGEFVKLPERFLKLEKTSKVKQEPQLLKKFGLRKKFFSTIIFNIVIKWKKDYHYIRAG